MIGAGFQHAAVYVLQSQPPQAAADAANTNAGPAPPQQVYKQMQVLPQPIEPTPMTPLILESIPVKYKQNGQYREMYLAQTPINQATGRPYPLTLLARYNSTWVEVAAALISGTGPNDAADNPGHQPGDGHQAASDFAAGSGENPAKRQKTSGSSCSSGEAGTSYDGSQAGAGLKTAHSASQQRERPRLWLTGANPRDDKVEFLDKIDQLAQFWWVIRCSCCWPERC